MERYSDGMNIKNTNIIKSIKTNDYHIIFSGIAFLGDERVECDKVLEMICREVEQGAFDFNKLWGWYKLTFYTYKTKEWYFWGDNNGSQRWYFNPIELLVSDSFLTIRDLMINPIEPDPVGTIEFLSMGITLDESTLLRNVLKTRASSVYIRSSKDIRSFSKNLYHFGEKNNITLDSIMNSLLSELYVDITENTCISITGGTDSRTILSYFCKENTIPRLVVTGHKNNIDVNIAKTISSALKKDIVCIDIDQKEKNWIENGFIFTDGMYDAVVGYNHYKINEWMSNSGIKYKFGGVGGEFYKNDFYKLPFCFVSKRRISKIMKNHHFNTHKLIQYNWISEDFREIIKNTSIPYIDKFDPRGSKLEICNQYGLEKFINTFSPISSAYSANSTNIDPLVDYQLIRNISNHSPMTLFQYRWERAIISRNAKELSMIRTDEGYTCSIKPLAFVLDLFCGVFNSLQKWFNILITQMIHRKRLKSGFWDNDYKLARKTAEWEKSIMICSQKGILAKEKSEEIPLSLTGKILQLGMLLDYNK